MTEQVYSMTYTRDGFAYSLLAVCDDLEHAEFIADSLGLSNPELVLMTIPMGNGHH